MQKRPGANAMADENKPVETANSETQDDNPYDAYGWEFHKRPLLYAVILTILFYAFVFFYINL
jgi:hypothetical protein